LGKFRPDRGCRFVVTEALVGGDAPFDGPHEAVDMIVGYAT
jgi:hypothetical protein